MTAKSKESNNGHQTTVDPVVEMTADPVMDPGVAMTVDPEGVMIVDPEGVMTVDPGVEMTVDPEGAMVVVEAGVMLPARIAVLNAEMIAEMIAGNLSLVIFLLKFETSSKFEFLVRISCLMKFNLFSFVLLNEIKYRQKCMGSE